MIELENLKLPLTVSQKGQRTALGVEALAQSF